MIHKIHNMARYFFVYLLMSLLFSTYLFAGEDQEKLIYQKFFRVMGTETQYNQMLNIMANQVKLSLGSSIRQNIETIAEINQVKREELSQLLEQAMEESIEKFKTAVIKEIPFDELISNIYIPVYSKYFTISEIEEITAFYESQVGQKLVSLVPTLMQESVEMFNEKYSNKIMEIDRRIRDEEFARIKSGIEELKRINEKIH